jgi:transposase-like protein
MDKDATRRITRVAQYLPRHRSAGVLFFQTGTALRLLHSTSPIERLNGEINRRTEVVGIFPKEEAIVRLIGAILLKRTMNGPSSAPVT